jgi:hypothetical protein
MRAGAGEGDKVGESKCVAGSSQGRFEWPLAYEVNMKFGTAVAEVHTGL